ncbi:MAG TPA: hypothetical protein VJG83_04790 [archaeon]|nr:hypothetical protein [archaeon]
MKKLVIKIGANTLRDMDKLGNPKNVGKFPRKVVYFKNIEQFSSILSAKKLQLLKYLSDVTGQSVTKIAIELERKKEAVSRDLHELEAIGFVDLKKSGKNVYAQVNYDSIQIDLKTSA